MIERIIQRLLNQKPKKVRVKLTSRHKKLQDIFIKKINFNAHFNTRKAVIFGLSVMGVYILATVVNYVFWYNNIFLKSSFTGGTFCLAIIFTAIFTAAFLGNEYRLFWRKHNAKNFGQKGLSENVDAGLENSTFLTPEEIKTHFTTVDFLELPGLNETGVVINAEENKGKYEITFAPNAHTLVIGATGSGKTTGFINPSVQILASTAVKPSMFITDPKGELFKFHAGMLKELGYTVKCVDLRQPFNSVKWNPLENIYMRYRRQAALPEEVVIDEKTGCYVFDNKHFYDMFKLKNYIKTEQQKIFDSVYEDVHDIISCICPVRQESKEPIWESGAKNLALAIALAMLEDSDSEALKMTKDKYNFYNLTNIASSTDRGCFSLKKYFDVRNDKSRAKMLSRQVLESSENTRTSYLTTLHNKLNMFADISICSLTSENEISFGSMAEKPTVVFLQVPDEKETRHQLASIMILQAYKELVERANQSENLTLPRPVYFILDEFGNIPLIPKFEQLITVARSRNIWFTLVVQSYEQLNKIYSKETAEIIKGNCNVQIFIGTTDSKTIEDFSKKCGKYSIRKISVSRKEYDEDSLSSSESVSERPLIYPSELATLNRPGNMGNAVVTIFGYRPLKAKYTPSYKSMFITTKKNEEKDVEPRYFDEDSILYNIRNKQAEKILNLSLEKEKGSNNALKTLFNKPDKWFKARGQYYNQLANIIGESLLEREIINIANILADDVTRGKKELDKLKSIYSRFGFDDIASNLDLIV